MARRSGGTHKGVEEKRRSLPIYQHYTLSPGKTKSHHPEAKCNHCLKEFVCGSKQRLIRHLRKCNSISNSDQIIAETLNTLARNSATGTLNHSILEASNLLPSQINPHLQHNHHQQQQPHHIVSHSINHSPSSTITTASSNIISTTNNGNGNNLTSTQINNSNHINHNTSGSNNDTGIIAGTSNGSQQPVSQVSNAIPSRKGRRGRRPAIRVASSSGIHVTTGLDGKTHFTPASQLPPTVVQGGPSGPVMSHMHNGCPVGYTIHGPVSSAPSVTPNSSNHMACVTPNHHQTTYKLNSEPIDKAYLKLVLTRNLPLSLCDTKEFQLWVKTFANDYRPPSSVNLVAQNLKNEAQAAKQRISNILVKAPKKTINLELHCWPYKLRQHQWYALIANLEHKRFLISIKDVIGTSQNNSLLSGDQPPDDNANNVNQSDKILSSFIDECISRVGSDRINSLMFSETRENDPVASRIHQALYTIHPSIITYHCWWSFTNQLCPGVEHNDRYHHVLKNRISLSDYMNWFLTHGKGLMDAWRQSTDGDRYNSLANYLNRFHAAEADFKLLFAAYLLNPRYRCAYMTQKAKDTAIEEILNIASEFMPEESDGRTIFDQWKLYLVREEPYDMVFDEGRSTPLEWWLSLPCAESIRRVALRILRLRAFTSPKQETLFSQLYFYEDETRTRLNESSFEDVAVLRYFYDFEDKTGQANSHTLNNQLSNSSISMSNSSNGYHDRSQLGHNDQINQANHSSSDIDISMDGNNQMHDSVAINETRQESFTDSYTEVVEPCLTNSHHTHITLQAPRVSIEDLPGYNLFIQYVDYGEPGVQIVEEPAEKKKRKWTAQEILSKCQ